MSVAKYVKLANMKKIAYSTLTALILFTMTFAHGDLENLSKQEVIDLQKSLINDGYLKEGSGFTWGKADEITDEARDRRQTEQSIQNIKNANAQSEAQKKTENKDSQPKKEKSFWDSFISFFKSLFI